MWNNSTLIKGNIVEETTKLKRQLGKDIGFWQRQPRPVAGRSPLEGAKTCHAITAHVI